MEPACPGQSGRVDTGFRADASQAFGSLPPSVFQADPRSMQAWRPAEDPVGDSQTPLECRLVCPETGKQPPTSSQTWRHHRPQPAPCDVNSDVGQGSPGAWQVKREQEGPLWSCPDRRSLNVAPQTTSHPPVPYDMSDRGLSAPHSGGCRRPDPAARVTHVAPHRMTPPPGTIQCGAKPRPRPPPRAPASPRSSDEP